MKRSILVLSWFLTGVTLIACGLGVKATEDIMPSSVTVDSIPTDTYLAQQTPTPIVDSGSDLAATQTSVPASAANQGIGICTQRISVEVDGISMRIPYCRNFALGTANEAIERAVVVIHGTNRTAENYFNYVMNAAAQVGGADSKTIILAPQFLTEEDIENNELGDEILYWSNGGWKRGDLSQTTDQNPRPVRISSFSLLDVILEKLADKNQFPNLAHIVIAGHSAGGQFVNRYAAGSYVPTTLTQQNNIYVRFIVSNPSSYLYFNEVRRVEGTLDEFSVPNAAICPEYNIYKYGLEDRNSYMSATGEEQLERQYYEREIIYLLGDEDNDPNASDLDTSCAAMLQGAYRLERGIIYNYYLIHYFGPDVMNQHAKVIVEGVGHSANGIFNSVCGIRYLFDYDPNGECGAILR